MKSTLILILLVTFNSILLSAQTGGDTLTCYTNSELQKIAKGIVYANECDTLYKIAQYELDNNYKQINNLNETLTAKDSVITLQDRMLQASQGIAVIQDEQLDDEKDKNKKLNRKLKWTQTGWVASVIVIILAAIL